MTRRVINQGAPTTTGGKVLAGVPNMALLDENVTTIGMYASCPICRSGCGIISPIDDVHVYVNRIQIALEGDIVSCGCPYGSNTVIANQNVMTVTKNANGTVTTNKQFLTPADDRRYAVELGKVLTGEAPIINTRGQSDEAAPSAPQSPDQEPPPMAKPRYAMSDPMPPVAPQPAEPEGFTVKDIPTVMRKKHWEISAQLMELWLHLPARAMSKDEKSGITPPLDIPARYCHTQLITWDWMMGFDRVRERLADLQQALTNTAGLNMLGRRFAVHIHEYSEPQTLNKSIDPMILHTHWQFQRRKVGYDIGQVISRDMDDLYGALGNFALYAAVTQATTQPLEGGLYQVSITEVGLYMRDTYDFNGTQYLGHWWAEGHWWRSDMEIKPLHAGLSEAHNYKPSIPNMPSQTDLDDHGFYNADFNAYRQRTGYGGDILLFSDVKKLPVNITIIMDPEQCLRDPENCTPRLVGAPE